MPVLPWSGSAKAQVLRRRQARSSAMGVLPGTHPETQHGLNLFFLPFHQAQFSPSRDVLLMTTVRLSASMARAFLYKPGAVKGKA